jgi:hypothetical protein
MPELAGGLADVERVVAGEVLWSHWISTDRDTISGKHSRQQNGNFLDQQNTTAGAMRGATRLPASMRPCR